MAPSKRSGITADELLAELEHDPEWVARRDARKAEMRAREERYLREETPLREELHRLGYPVKWVWDFVNAKQNYYVDAIPTLIDHLQRPYGDEIREGIARSLAMKEARGLVGAVLVEVLNERGLGEQLRWALANTLATVADRSNHDGIKVLLARETNADVADRLNRALRKAVKP